MPGRNFACTWQVGEAQAIAAALRVPVVSNFRPADMLAGGQGAPLVPLLDYFFFADARRGRVLQNIGGIANLTGIPPKAPPHAVLAFDTGPGNMVIDWLAQKLFDKDIRSQWRFGGDGRRDCAGAGRGVAESVLPVEAAADCWTRAIRARVCGKVSCACRKHSKNNRRAGHRDGADGRDDCAELCAFCAARR